MEGLTGIPMPKLNKWHIQRLFRGLRKFKKSFPGEEIDWEKILHNSDLNCEGYSSDQLLKLFLYLRKEYGIESLNEMYRHQEEDLCAWEVPDCSVERFQDTERASIKRDWNGEPVCRYAVHCEETTGWKPNLGESPLDQFRFPLIKSPGYGFTVADWKEALYRCPLLLRRMNEFDWIDDVFEPMNIASDRKGSDIMNELYSDIVPRIRELGYKGEVNLEPHTPSGDINRFALMAIFHGIRRVTPSGVKDVIKEMLSNDVLAVPRREKNPVQFWYRLLISVLKNETLGNADYFNTSEPLWSALRTGRLNDGSEYGLLFDQEAETVSMAFKPYELKRDELIAGSRAESVDWTGVLTAALRRRQIDRLVRSDWFGIILELNLTPYKSTMHAEQALHIDQLERDFYAFAVPRLREFGCSEHLKLQPYMDGKPDHTNNLAMIAIFHSMSFASPSGVKSVLSDLIRKGVLDTVIGSDVTQELWYNTFVFRLCMGNRFEWNAPYSVVELFMESWKKNGGVLEAYES